MTEVLVALTVLLYVPTFRKVVATQRHLRRTRLEVQELNEKIAEYMYFEERRAYQPPAFEWPW